MRNNIIDAARLDTGGGTLRRQAVGLADIAAFLLELGIARAIDPATGAMRFEIDLAQKATDLVGGDLGDDFARDRLGGEWMGKPLSPGASHTSAMIAQICSGATVFPDAADQPGAHATAGPRWLATVPANAGRWRARGPTVWRFRAHPCRQRRAE